MTDEEQSVSNMMRKRLGAMALIISLGALGLAVLFFASDDLVVMQLDFSGDEDTFGWISMVISFGAAGIALFLFLTMTSD